MATQSSPNAKVLGKYFSDTGELKIPIGKLQKSEHILDKAKAAIQLVREKQSGKINSGVFYCTAAADSDTTSSKIWDGALTRKFKTPNPPESMVNCSLCTVAAIGRRLTAANWTTEKVIQQLHLGEDKSTYFPGQYLMDYHRKRSSKDPQSYKAVSMTSLERQGDKTCVKDQIAGVKEWCLQELGATLCGEIGSDDKREGVGSARQQMGKCKPGTLFAVFLASNTAAHWIFAERVLDDEKVVFLDCQTDRAECPDSAPTSSFSLIKPGGEEIDESEEPSWKVVVLAFEGKKAPVNLSGLTKDTRPASKPVKVAEDEFADFDFTRD